MEQGAAPILLFTVWNVCENIYRKEQNVAGLSYQQAKTPEQNNHYDGCSSNNDKLHVFAFFKKEKKKRKQKRKKKAIPDEKDYESIHIWVIGSRRKSNGDAYRNDDIRKKKYRYCS